MFSCHCTSQSTGVSLTCKPSTIGLLPALLSSPPLCRPPACSGPGQAKEKAGCWCGKVGGPSSTFLHLGLGLGRTCRRVCGLGLLSDLQELMTLLMNKHTHTHNVIKVVQRLGEVRES